MSKSTSRISALLSCVLLAGCHAAPAPVPPAPVATPTAASAYPNGQAVVTAMRDRYAGRWYRTVTFTQKTSQLTPAGTWTEQTWYESMSLPGSLRIDFDPLKAGNGVLYARDSQYVIVNFKVARKDPGINDLLLLGFDVYANTTARTAALLRQQGFDLSRVHADTLGGRRMIVVGAEPGDLHSKQFWVDAERLYFVRLLEPAPRDSTKIQEIRFLNYTQYGDAWLAPRVELYNDGKLIFSEDYSDIRTNVPVADVLFDPYKWRKRS